MAVRQYFHRIPGKDDTWTIRERGNQTHPRHYFYIFLAYLHQYPALDNCASLSTSQIDVRRTTLTDTIIPCGRMWSRNINFIRWADRMNPMNHHPFFPLFVTTIFDSTKILVHQPMSGTEEVRMTLNGHYKQCCLLVLTGITFTGQLVYGSNLLRSTSYDAHTFNDTSFLHPRRDWEMSIGDNHFKTCPRFMCPFAANGPLSREQTLFNELIQLARSRVEHLNTAIKNSPLFKTPYRGHVHTLQALVTVSLHITALKQRLAGERYAGYGPWNHDGSDYPFA